ncbi:MAG: acyl carrier protein [Defluviitaleaceae bacterium]|nr:acyl carrier protein [Defluviitaleaceae bacterium]
MMKEKIIAIIAEQLGKNESEITMETNFREDLDADSLDLFQIISDIEDEFDIKIDDAEGIATVADAVKFVEEASK